MEVLYIDYRGNHREPCQSWIPCRTTELHDDFVRHLIWSKHLLRLQREPRDWCSHPYPWLWRSIVATVYLSTKKWFKQNPSKKEVPNGWSPGSCVVWTCLRMFGHCVVEIETGRQKMGIASIHEILPNPCKTFTLVFPQLQRAPAATAPWGKTAPWKLCSGTMIAFPAWQRQTGRRKPRIPKLQPALRNNVGVGRLFFPHMLTLILVDARGWTDPQTLTPKGVTDLKSVSTHECQHFLTRSHRLWSRRTAQELVRFQQKYEELERDFIQLRSEHTKLQTLRRNLHVQVSQKLPWRTNYPSLGCGWGSWCNRHCVLVLSPAIQTYWSSYAAKESNLRARDAATWKNRFI